MGADLGTGHQRTSTNLFEFQIILTGDEIDGILNGRTIAQKTYDKLREARDTQQGR